MVGELCTSTSSVQYNTSKTRVVYHYQYNMSTVPAEPQNLMTSFRGGHHLAGTDPRSD